MIRVYIGVESNKGKKAIDKKSDELYIRSLVSAYYPSLINSIEFLHMEGKNNHQKIYKEAMGKSQIFKQMNKNGDTVIILVFDKDNFDKDQRDSKFVGEIENKYKQKAKVIWFTRDIENVLLGKSTGHNKTKEAKKFKVLEKDKVRLRKKLSNQNPCTSGSSNFCKIFDEIVKKER